MPLVKTTDLLADCKQNHYAVGAFNINGLDQPQALIRRAEELGAPLIVVEPGVIEKYVNFEDFVAVTRRAARDASIPVSIHLSHGLDLEQVERAARAGFTSVMYDGSKFPFDENVANTQKAVSIGRRYGVAVEGELGALASSFADISETMTDPEKAREFVAKTGVDILAVSIGNSHGFYKGTPHLDFKRLAEIREAIRAYPCYLTLHGGSGISEEGFRTCIAEGITKICIYTEMCSLGRKKAERWLSEHRDYTGNYDTCDLIAATLTGFTASEEHCMNVFGSTGRSPSIPALADAVPENRDIGPAYPSLVAENPGFQSTGKFWDEI